MLVARPVVFRKRRPTARAASEQRPPVAPLVLVSAVLEAGDDVLLRLAFDRAIDLAGFEPAQVTVDDGADTGTRYVGLGVDDMPTPASLVLLLAPAGAAAGPGVVMNASAAALTLF